MGSDFAGWLAMCVALTAMCFAILALVHVPGARPSAEVLRCDSLGGYWSSIDNACHRSDSPAAGLAS